MANRMDAFENPTYKDEQFRLKTIRLKPSELYQAREDEYIHRHDTAFEVKQTLEVERREPFNHEEKMRDAMIERQFEEAQQPLRVYHEPKIQKISVDMPSAFLFDEDGDTEDYTKTDVDWTYQSQEQAILNHEHKYAQYYWINRNQGAPPPGIFASDFQGDA